MLSRQPNENEESRLKRAANQRADELKARIVERDGKPVVSIEQISMSSNGKPVKKRVEIDLKRFSGLLDIARAHLDHGEWREARMPRSDVAANRSTGDKEPKRQKSKSEPEPKQAKEYWPVVSVHKTLSTGAIVSVDRTFTSRQAAEKHALRSGGRAALAVSMSIPHKQGEKLVIAETEASPKLKSLIRYHREYEREYGERLERLAERRRLAEERRWTGGESFGKRASAYSPGRLVWSKTVGGARADVFSKFDAKGVERRTVILTWRERQKDGSLKEVSTEHDLRSLLELHRRFRNSERPEREETRRCVMGVWRGAEKPRKDQRITLETQGGAGGRSWVAPVGEKPTPSPDGSRPVYVVCGPTNEQGVYRVLGSTKDLGLAETRLADIERVRAKAQRDRSDWAFERLSTLAAQYDPWDRNLKTLIDRLARRGNSEDRASRNVEQKERPANVQPHQDGRGRGFHH